ncbi:MAG: response regulator [Acidobacteriota bacterium]|jgi:putative two-component system response regulator|nr:response regulator [Acidobacteriota bacterium]
MPMGKEAIILVDDNPSNLRVGKSVLGDKYTTYTASSATSMFEMLERIRPSLILLDIDMPEMNGYEAIKKLKQDPGTKDIPVIFVTGNTDTNSELDGFSLGAVDYITKPFVPALLIKRIKVHLENKNLNENLQKMVHEKTREVMKLHDAIMTIVADLVECRDETTGNHIERTQHVMRLLIEALQKDDRYRRECSNWDVDLMLRSSRLHDVGKIQISDTILNKPGSLTPGEYEAMKKHAQYGVDIINRIEFLAEEGQSDFFTYAKIFAGTHHERPDGKGYPNGMRGEDIPLLGRIMAIADVYDALISARPYKRAFSKEESLRIIRDGGGTQFDATLVEVFLAAAHDL